MPHKKNPVRAERISVLSRLLRAYLQVGLENVALWHERDISHSSAERVIFPDACIVLDYMLGLMTELISGLVVYPERMRSNLDLTGGLIYSQRVLLALVDAGMDRQDAYKLVQRHAMAARDGAVSFRESLAHDPNVTSRLSEAELAALFDPEQQLTEVDRIFERLGLPAAVHAHNHYEEAVPA